MPSLIFILIWTSLSFAEELKPFNDNVLFAFDKCKTLTVDLNKTDIEEMTTGPFDIHCVNAQSDKLLFKCDFFDAGSNKKTLQEALTGGKTEKFGNLSNKGGTSIKFSLEKGAASFESPLTTQDEHKIGRKICAGIFLFEKDAKNRKK